MSTKMVKVDSQRLLEQCDGERNPKTMAEKILNDDTGKYTELEYWLSSNYLNALGVLEGKALIEQITSING